MKLLACLLLLITSITRADDVTAVVAGLHEGSYLLTVQGGAVTVTPVILVRPGPTPTPIPVPNLALAEIVRAQVAAVPDYTNKAVHLRAMAEAITFVRGFIGTADPSKSRPLIRSAVDVAAGNDKAKWAPLWSAVDAKLDSVTLTPQAYDAALAEIASELVRDLPSAAGDPNHGLPPEVWMELLKLLIELIKTWLANR